jgi:hypothetical protein
LPKKYSKTWPKRNNSFWSAQMGKLITIAEAANNNTMLFILLFLSEFSTIMLLTLSPALSRDQAKLLNWMESVATLFSITVRKTIANIIFEEMIDYCFIQFRWYTYIKYKKHAEGISHHQIVIKFDYKVVQLQKVAESVKEYAAHIEHFCNTVVTKFEKDVVQMEVTVIFIV